MAEATSGDLFASYGSLLDVQWSLSTAVHTATPAEAAELRGEIAAVAGSLAELEANPWLPRSALSYGAALARDVDVLLAAGGTPDAELGAVYARRLQRATGFVITRCAGRPELAEDQRLHLAQEALGRLAAAGISPVDAYVPGAAPAADAERPLDAVSYDTALQNLRAHLALFEPGEEYELSAAQLVTIAAPNMAFKPWHRTRFITRLRRELAAEGYTMRYNHRRGKYAAYTVGRPALPARSTLPIAV